MIDDLLLIDDAIYDDYEQYEWYGDTRDAEDSKYYDPDQVHDWEVPE